MNADPFRDALILTGPTGSGKTALALDLAERLDADVVCMDSMTLYRGMDVGTAKPTAEERRRVPHHLVDVLDPWQSASVAWWLEQAAHACRAIRERGRQVLVVGGTPLYLKAMLRGLFDGPPADPELRRRLADEADVRGAAALHERLAAVDPTSAARLHPNDLRRVIRALEVWELTGRPISDFQHQWAAPVPEALQSLPRVLWLDLPRQELYERINARVEQMFQAGLVDEVRRLCHLGRPLSAEAAQALGYKEVLAYLDGTATLDATKELIRTRSRNFAKRQVTWFRHLPECRPVRRELTWELWRSRMKG